jgi:hypothetical protein
MSNACISGLIIAAQRKSLTTFSVFSRNLSLILLSASDEFYYVQESLESWEQLRSTEFYCDASVIENNNH